MQHWSSGYDVRLTRGTSPVQSWDAVIFDFFFVRGKVINGGKIRKRERSYGVTVSTLDSESSDGGSNPPRTCFVMEMLGLLFKTNMRSAARTQPNVSQRSFYTI